MAKLFGKPDETDPHSEHTVFTALAELPDAWRIFYSVGLDETANHSAGSVSRSLLWALA